MLLLVVSILVVNVAVRVLDHRMANDSDELITKVRRLRYSSNGRRVVYLFACMMWAHMLLDRTSLSWDRCLMVC